MSYYLAQPVVRRRTRVVLTLEEDKRGSADWVTAVLEEEQQSAPRPRNTSQRSNCLRKYDL